MMLTLALCYIPAKHPILNMFFLGAFTKQYNQEIFRLKLNEARETKPKVSMYYLEQISSVEGEAV